MMPTEPQRHRHEFTRDSLPATTSKQRWLERPRSFCSIIPVGAFHLAERKVTS